MLESQLMKLVRQASTAGAVDLVDRQRDRFAQAPKHAGQIAIRGGELAAAVDQKDDVIGAFQGHARLPQDFTGDQSVVILDDAAGIDQVEFPGAILGLPVDAVAGNARLIADD